MTKFIFLFGKCVSLKMQVWNRDGPHLKALNKFLIFLKALNKFRVDAVSSAAKGIEGILPVPPRTILDFLVPKAEPKPK